VLFKTMFSWRTLHQAGERVRQPLAAGDLDGAREGLRWLVSRDTAGLDAPLLAAAAIESLAENASDSVTAPLLAYALLGLPGACAYRAVNTLDAMVGYRGRYEYLGKVPARLDDLLNLVPARLTGLLIVAAAALCSADARQAWQTLQRDHAATDSPNAGYPMAAIAGALGVRLEKAGHYCLNASGRKPTAEDLRRASRVVGVGLGVASLAACLLTLTFRRSNS
jgi:adenosylcobinamide-phosphate synthase